MIDARSRRWGLLISWVLTGCVASAQRSSSTATATLTQVDRDVAACRASPTRCRQLAATYIAEDRGGADAARRASDLGAALRVSTAGCDLRDAPSCLYASLVLRERAELPAALRMAERGCSLDHGPSCTELSAIRGAEGPLFDREIALRTSRRACDLGSAVGCSNHAIALRQFRGPFDPARREMARFLRLGCADDNAMGCVLLGRAMVAGEDGIDRDAARAGALFRSACERRPPLGCFEFGQLALRDGGGSAESRESAATAFAHACEGREVQGCVALYEIVRTENHPDTPRRMALVLGRACELQHGPSCVVLAVLHLRGTGVVQDVERAAPILHRACEAGSAVACAELSRFYAELARPDGRRAADYGDRGCALNSEAACSLAVRARLRFPTAGGRSDALAFASRVCDGTQRALCPAVVNTIVHEGVATQDELVTRDVLPLLDQACQRGANGSCVASANLRMTGLFGIPAEIPRAVGELIRVCQTSGEDSALACDLAAGFTRAGVGTERDLVRAAARARTACERGHGSSCGMLAFMTARAEGVEANLAEAARLSQRECDGRPFCARSLDDRPRLASLCRAAPEIAVGGAAEGETRGDDLTRASCGSLARSPEQVFRLLVRRRESLRVEVQRTSAGYDPVVHVRRTCADERSEIACNDDPLAGLNERSRVERVFEPGTYWIFVDGFGATNTGRFRLTVSTTTASQGGVVAGPRA